MYTSAPHPRSQTIPQTGNRKAQVASLLPSTHLLISSTWSFVVLVLASTWSTSRWARSSLIPRSLCTTSEAFLASSLSLSVSEWAVLAFSPTPTDCSKKTCWQVFFSYISSIPHSTPVLLLTMLCASLAATRPSCPASLALFTADVIFS